MDYMGIPEREAVDPEALRNLVYCEYNATVRRCKRYASQAYIKKYGKLKAKGDLVRAQREARHLRTLLRLAVDSSRLAEGVEGSIINAPIT